MLWCVFFREISRQAHTFASWAKERLLVAVSTFGFAAHVVLGPARNIRCTHHCHDVAGIHRVEDMLWASQMSESWTLTAPLHRAELVVLDPVISGSTFCSARVRGSKREAWAATVGGAKAGDSTPGTYQIKRIELRLLTADSRRE